MRSFSLRWVVAVALAVIGTISLHAEYLENTDFKDSIGGWHGDGQAANLKNDGTEDPLGQPVIKLSLSRSEAHMVYQEFRTSDKPAALHIKVDILASSDYERSKSLGDYTHEILDYHPGDYFSWSDIAVCNVDFWFRIGSTSGTTDWYYELAQATAGKWVTVENKFTPAFADKAWTLYFCVPPGNGAVYIRNPSVTP